MADNNGSLGRHELVVSGDVALIRVHGDITLPNLVALYEQLNQLVRQHGQFFLIADVRDSGTITPEARRYAGQHRFGRLLRFVAIFGVGTVMRALIAMIIRSAALLAPTAEFPLTRFASTEDEARALVDSIKQAQMRATEG